MISFNQIDSQKVLNNHISVQVAASYSGYSTQYLRRLLRTGKLEVVKIGQLWLVDKDFLDHYMEKAQDSANQRFGPK